MPESKPAAHTAGKWHVGAWSEFASTVYDSDGLFILSTDSYIAKEVSKHSKAECVANAAHIVRSVNSHDALVAALRAYQKSMRKQYEPSPNVPCTDCDENGKCSWCELYLAAEAALKLAEEKV